MRTIRITRLGLGLMLVGASLSGMAAPPQELSNDQLEAITAGNQSHPAPNGGAIVGNGATATLQSTGEVVITDASQSEAAALNLVNSSESTVANGVNVFDGRIDQDASLDAVITNVDQQNHISQDQRRLSSLPDYARGTNSETTSTDAGSSASNSSASTYDQVTDLERSFVTDAATTSGGFAQSGSPTAVIDAELEGIGSYYVEANAPSASNSVGVVFNGRIDINIDGGGINADFNRTGENTVTTTTDGADSTTVAETGAALDLGLEVQMPELNINFDAMGCVAVNGDCTIDGTRTETTDIISDHSTLITSDETSESDATWDKSSTNVVNAPFELADAQAEYIVVDESTLDVTAGYLVSLSGGAQADLRGMNIVNAAGSAVANGVNVATQRTAGSLESSGPSFTLKQFNKITHSR